jgi:hypothetical protein
MQIDYYSEVLVGCLHCNRWGRPGDKTLIMELLEEDVEALRDLRLGRAVLVVRKSVTRLAVE